MRSVNVYDNISELLGDEKKRFFGNGYKLVNHEIMGFVYNDEKKAGEGTVKIVYNDAFSEKDGISLSAHFTTLDLLVLASYTSQKIIEYQFTCKFNECWFNMIKVSSIKSSTDLKENILDFRTVVNSIEICKLGYKVSLTTFASNLKFDCSLYVCGELKEDTEAIQHFESVLFQETSIGNRYLTSYRKIEDTYINSSCEYLISRISIKSLDTIYYDVFDMFLCMSQQIQALFYKYDDLDRDETNNLWMREITFEAEKQYKINKPFYQLISLSKTSMLDRGGDVVWRLGNFKVNILDFPELKINAKVAHILPVEKGGIVSNG